MSAVIGKVCRYLFLPEDTTCEGMGCLKEMCNSRVAGAVKSVLWLGVSILCGVGLARMC